MNITFLDRDTIDLHDISFSEIESCGHFVSYSNSTDKEIVSRSQTSDIIITNKVPITQFVLEHCKNIKLIAVIATGYNNVDLAFAREKGILVCNVAGYAKNTVSTLR